MKKLISIAIITASLSAVPAMAQEYNDAYYERARANQGHAQQNVRQASAPALSGPTAAIMQCNALLDGTEIGLRAQGQCLRSVERISDDIANYKETVVRENSRYGQQVLRTGERVYRTRSDNGNRVVRDIIRAVSK